MEAIDWAIRPDVRWPVKRAIWMLDIVIAPVAPATSLAAMTIGCRDDAGWAVGSDVWALPIAY